MLKTETRLERAAYPEQVGVKSDVVEDFLRALDAKKLNMHSLMIMKDGKVASECYWHPYKPEVPMSMFSFSKGVTATAIGIAVGEGLLTLDDKISRYFPHKFEKELDNERYSKLTVYDLITHRSGKSISILDDKENNDWAETWLNAEMKVEPGTKFNYLSENTYMLSNLLTKITGQTVAEYLTPRLFEPLGIKTPYWECDHHGVNAGGWGAFLKLEDISKFGICYLNKGKWDGKQIIPEDWIDDAIQPHVSKIPSIFNKNTGYGYQIFVQSERNTYSFNGLYGQFVVVYPEYNAVFTCTSGECDELTFIHTLNDYLPQCFSNEQLAENKEAKASLDKYIRRDEHPVVWPARRKPESEALINGRDIHIKKLNQFASILGPSTSFMLSQKAGNIDNLKFIFEENRILLSFNEKNSEPCTVDIGLGKRYNYSEAMLSGIKLHIAAHATWIDDKTLSVNIVPLEMAQEREMTFRFTEDGVRIHSVAMPGFYDLFNFYLMFNGIKPILPLKGAIKAFCVYANHAFDPNFKGKFTD